MSARLGVWFMQQVLARLPLRVLRAMGWGIGRVLFVLAAPRRKVALRNLELCFPQATPAQRRIWARETFVVFCQTWLDRGWLWAAPREVVLRRGEAVGLLPDQVPPEGQGLWVPFFGRDAYTMTLAARLALQTGAAVLLVHAERLPWGRGYVVHLESMSDPLADTLEAAVLQINQAMEHVIRQCPQQYLWGYARYKQPRVEASAGGAA